MLIWFQPLRFCSKLQSEVLRETITQIVTDAKEKKRNFTETVELQIGLKNYDPQKDKRFSGSVRLPHIPRPKMKICMLGDAQHVEEVQFHSLLVFFVRKSYCCTYLKNILDHSHPCSFCFLFETNTIIPVFRIGVGGVFSRVEAKAS